MHLTPWLRNVKGGFLRTRPWTSRRHPSRRPFTPAPQVEVLEDRTLLTQVTALNPGANSHVAPLGTDVEATFDQNIDGSTVNDQTFVIHAMQSRRLLAASGDITSLTTMNATVTLEPAADFHPGEMVQVTVTAGIESTGAEPAVPHVWQFRTAPTGGSGLFSGQTLGHSTNTDVALGDVDGDGDLDAFVANDYDNRIWLNDGSGNFTDSGQQLGYSWSLARIIRRGGNL